MTLNRVTRLAVPLLFAVSGLVAAVACGEPRSAHDVQKDNPLGPSFWIIPVPGDDDALLGRTFPRSPDPSRTLEEQSTPNPCADKLQERRETAMQNHFEDAIDTKSGAQAGALLSLYGFSADASVATHLLYKVDTATKISRIDTAEYQQCCREKACGWGYVASLVRGNGEYASAREASAQASGNYAILSGGVSHSYAVSTKREVKGYIAAILVEHKRGDAAQSCGRGEVWAKIECVPAQKLSEQEDLCKKGNPKATDPATKDNASMQSMFKQQQTDACKWLDLHGGPSTALPPPPPASTTAARPTVAQPPPAAPTFEPGEYSAINSFWSGKITFMPDGTFQRDNEKGDKGKGIWIFEGGTLQMKWADRNEDQLTLSSPGTFKNMTGFFTIKRVGPVPGHAPPPPAAASSSARPQLVAPPKPSASAASTPPAAPASSMPPLRKRP